MTKELITFLETVSGKTWVLKKFLCLNYQQKASCGNYCLKYNRLLTISEAEFKSSCSSGMLSAVEKYAPGPGKKCAIDTLFEVLRAAGNWILATWKKSIHLFNWDYPLMPNIWKAIVIDFFIGKYVRDDVIFNTIQLVSWNPELQPYVAQESWAALKASSNSYSEKQPLTQVTLWDRDLGKS